MGPPTSGRTTTLSPEETKRPPISVPPPQCLAGGRARGRDAAGPAPQIVRTKCEHNEDEDHPHPALGLRPGQAQGEQGLPQDVPGGGRPV